VIPRTNSNNANPDYNRVGDYRPANDFAVLTQGQLKNMAIAAYNEFMADVGVNSDMTALVAKWVNVDPVTGVISPNAVEIVTADTADFAPVNLGQLKAVAQPFYEELIALGVVPGYPWFNSENTPADYTAANVGQAKQLFSFDIIQDLAGVPSGGGSSTDFLGGIPYTWFVYYGLNPVKPGNGPNDDSDGDGLTNLQEAQMGTDPNKKDNPALQLTISGYAAH